MADKATDASDLLAECIQKLSAQLATIVVVTHGKTNVKATFSRHWHGERKFDPVGLIVGRSYAWKFTAKEKYPELKHLEDETYSSKTDLEDAVRRELCLQKARAWIASDSFQEILSSMENQQREKIRGLLIRKLDRFMDYLNDGG